MEGQQKYSANSYNNVAQLQLMQLIDPGANRVLDLGCGDGKTTRVLQELLPNAQLYGLTANETEAEENSDDTLQIVYGDAHKLPFQNSFFDAVYARHILEHCVAPFIAIKELNRVLSLGGQLIVAVPENNEWADSFPDHYSVLSQMMWEKLFVQCGFSIKKSFKGTWFAWGASAELPELRFQLEKITDVESGEELAHVFAPKIGNQLIEPPKMLTKNPLAFVFHNLVTYESMRNVLFKLKENDIPFDIIVPVSESDENAQLMFEDTALFISKEFSNVMLGIENPNIRYKAVFYPFLPFFFSVESDYVVRYQYGIGKAEYNFDIWSMSFDYILCQSDYDYRALKNYTQAKLLGNPKFLNSAKTVPNEDFTILYMPTYGELSSLDERFELITKLKEKYNIKIKLHHMTLYYEPERVKKIKEVFEAEEIFTHENFLNDILGEIDLIITDTSGSIFDSIQYGIPLALLKKKSQVFHGSPTPLEEQLVMEGKIPTIYSENDFELVQNIKEHYSEQCEKVEILKQQIFPIAIEDAVENYYRFIQELLKNNVDLLSLEINRKKLLYMTKLESNLASKKVLLKKLEESFVMQKSEILAMLEEYKNRVKDLSDQLVNLRERTHNKDTRIINLSDQLNALYETQSLKDTRINELSEDISMLRQLQNEKDIRINELSEAISLLSQLQSEKDARITELSEEISLLSQPQIEEDPQTDETEQETADKLRNERE
ncbi:class I SAM-dependent methyltransferase [Paenibacillus massiliensis]|uniref:class I SAM-dependent methyltransferase n=1 Tax=Paenibacillus massiliensis TaxID=225917 RepID=UPI0003737065|nr:class I SAM-dependent methyltransferase [Paenibacillus massiliensis]